MFVQRIEKHNYVFGMRWVAPIKADEGGSEIKLLRSLGLGRNDPVYGVKSTSKATGIYGKRKLKNGISAAALLAISNPLKTILLTVRINEDIAWFCAVNNGEVVPGADVVSDHDDILNQSAVFYSIFPAGEKIELESLDGLSNVVDHSKIEGAVILEITKIKIKQAIVGMITAAIAVGVIFMVVPKPAPKAAPIVTAKRIDPKTQVMTALKSKPGPREVVNIVMRVISTQPRLIGGWMFSSVALSPKRMRLTWVRKYAVNAHELFKHVPHAVLSFDGNRAILDGRLNSAIKKRITILSANHFIQIMLPVTQEMKSHGTTLQYKPPVNKSAIASIKTSFVKTDLGMGQWSAAGKGLGSLQHDAIELASGGVLMVDTLMIKLDKDMSWKMEGNYVVKN